MQNKESISRHVIQNILTRDFVLVFLAFFIFAAANHALTPTIPIYLAKLGSIESEIGVLVGIFGVSSLISRFLVGGWLLKHSEKSAMMTGTILFALGSLAFIVFRPFWPFFAVRFMQGVAFACLDTAAFAFVVNVIPMAYRGQGLAYFMLAPNLALAVAPAFALFLINKYSFTLFFLTCMALALGAFVFACLLKGKETVRLEGRIPVSHNRFFDSRIVAPAIVGFLHTFVYGAIVAFFPLYAIQNGVNNPGLFFSAVAIMIIAGRALGARMLDAWSKDKVILTFLSAAMVAMIILSFSETLPMFIVVGLLWGTGTSFVAPATMTYAFEYADSSGGTAVGTFRALTDSGVALGPMIMGILIPLTGYRIMFLCLAIICLINLCYFQFYVRRRHNVA
jgi:MFS family permease